nr:MAG TPA: hypothetical protein [Myoviridae sp. cttWQ44]
MLCVRSQQKRTKPNEPPRWKRFWTIYKRPLRTKRAGASNRPRF